jgi:hypothetical protein
MLKSKYLGMKHDMQLTSFQNLSEGHSHSWDCSLNIRPPVHDAHSNSLIFQNVPF